MRIAIPRTVLRSLVTGFNKVVLRRPRLPVLEHILFEHRTDNDVTITATDLEQTLEYTLADAVRSPEGADAFLFPFSELKPFAKGGRAGEELLLHPTANDTVALVAGVNGQPVRSEVAVMDTDEWPRTVKTVDTHPYPVATLAEACRTALPFASTDETRQVGGIRTLAGAEPHRSFVQQVMDSVDAVDEVLNVKEDEEESELRLETLTQELRIKVSDLEKIAAGEGTAGEATGAAADVPGGKPPATGPAGGDTPG